MINETNIEKLNECLLEALKKGDVDDATKLAKELTDAKRAENEFLNNVSRAQNEIKKIESNERVETKKLKKPWYEHLLEGCRIAIPAVASVIGCLLTYKLGNKQVEVTDKHATIRQNQTEKELDRFGYAVSSASKSELRKEDRIRDYK